MSYGMFNASIGVGQIGNGITAVSRELPAAQPVAWRGSAADSFSQALQGARLQAGRTLDLVGSLQWSLTEAQNSAAAEIMER